MKAQYATTAVSSGGRNGTVKVNDAAAGDGQIRQCRHEPGAAFRRDTLNFSVAKDHMTIKNASVPKQRDMHREKDAASSAELMELASLEADILLKRLGTQQVGLTDAEASSPHQTIWFE